MKLEKEKLIELSEVAIKAAKEGGAFIQSRTGEEVHVERKETGASLASQVVTEVDHAVQEIVLKHVRPTCKPYDLGLLAEEEEDDGSRFEKDYFWCIDPMDGTLPFIENRPGYAISIGLVSNKGEPMMGVVLDPRENILYHAIKGVGAFRNEKPWELSLEKREHEEIDRGGAVMNACWVLENGAACFYKKPKKESGGGCVWDYAATACLFEALGAWVSDFNGDPLELNRKEAPHMNHRGVLFATNETIAKQYI